MDHKFLVTTTAITAFASAGMVASVTPAAAADPVKVNVFSPQPVSGYVEAYGSLGHTDNLKEAGSFGQIGGAGRLNYWMSPNRALQIDAYGTGTGKDGSGDSAFGLAAHLAKRDANRGAVGVMVSLGTLYGDMIGTIAIQGQHYSGPWTFYGQVGIQKPFTCCWSGTVYPYASLQARYFTNPNTMISGDVTVADFNGSFFGQVGLGIEHRAMNTPFSFFARAQASREEGWATSGQVLVGAKLWVNQDTLLSNDRNGATFLDLNPFYGEFANKFAL